MANKLIPLLNLLSSIDNWHIEKHKRVSGPFRVHRRVRRSRWSFTTTGLLLVVFIYDELPYRKSHSVLDDRSAYHFALLLASFRRFTTSTLNDTPRGVTKKLEIGRRLGDDRLRRVQNLSGRFSGRSRAAWRLEKWLIAVVCKVNSVGDLFFKLEYGRA